MNFIEKLQQYIAPICWVMLGAVDLRDWTEK